MQVRFKKNVFTKFQVLDISHNVIDDLPGDLFHNVKHLRVVDMSYNLLKSLPDSIFNEGGLES